jgi:hypothetical protein
MPSGDWEVSETGEKLNGIAFTLIGITNMLSSIGLIILLLTLGGFLETLGIVATDYGVQIPTFTTYIGVGWAFAILQLIAGFVALADGIAILTKPKEA